MRELAISQWVIDREADAAYLELATGKISKTVNFGMINVDLDENDNAMGVELLTLRPDQWNDERNTSTT